MSQSRPAAESSYGRSAGQASARGLALLLVSLIVGFLLLRGVDDKARDAAPQTTASNTVATPDTVAPTVDPAVDPNAATVPSTTPPAVVGATPRAPSLVRVLVLNGSGKNRAASKVAESLKSGQYDVKKSLDANASNLTAAVYWNPGFQTEAAVIATYLNIPNAFGPMPAPPPIKEPAKAEAYDIIVVVDVAMADRNAGASAPAGSGQAPTAAGPTAANPA